MDVPMELARIVISETSPQQIILLKEINGNRSFPIVIGIGEALAIDRRLKGQAMPRPMTHDLLADVIESLGGHLEQIRINDLRDHTFIAALILRQGQRRIEVDARPSDAIALGVAFSTPILVAQRVLDQIQNESIDLSSQRENLQFRRDELAQEISALSSQLSDEAFLSAVSNKQVQELKQQLSQMQTELEAIENILSQLP